MTTRREWKILATALVFAAAEYIEVACDRETAKRMRKKVLTFRCNLL